MKKSYLFVAAMAAVSFAGNAQDLQLHYDLGRNITPEEQIGRPKVTLTYEAFKADQLGNWFYFVDVDFSRKFTESAYTEVSREFCVGMKGFAAHLEYNGGLNKSMSFQQSALFGAAWNGHNGDFSTTYSVQLLYKRFFKSYDYTSAYHSFQLTGVWSTNFCNDSFTFSGYIDFWRGEKAFHHGQLVMMTEPQLWFNLNKLIGGINLSVGTEWEISNNFVFNTDPISDKTFFCNPTVALKWNF